MLNRLYRNSFVVIALAVAGLVAAIFMRNEATELRRECPGCGKVVPAHDALCTRCGAELYLPPEDELLPSKFTEKLHGR